MPDHELGATGGPGSRLQWWQEVKKETKPRWWQETAETRTVGGVQVDRAKVGEAVAAVTSAEQTLDIGDELELEAIRRAHAESTGARVVVPFHRARYVRELRRRAITVTLLQAASILMQISLALFAHVWGPMIAVPLNLLAIFMVWRGLSEAKTADNHAPVMVMTDDGLDLAGIGLIHWHEIAEVRRHGSSPSQMALVVPHDCEALERRLRAARPKGRKIRQVRSYVFRFGKRGQQHDLPPGVVYAINHWAAGLTVDEAVDRVNSFRSARHL